MDKDKKIEELTLENNSLKKKLEKILEQRRTAQKKYNQKTGYAYAKK